MINSADHNLPALPLHPQALQTPVADSPIIIRPPPRPRANLAEIGVITQNAYDKAKNKFSLYSNNFIISQTEHNSVLTKTMLDPKYDF